jgi:hypothetical protein
MLTVYRMSSSTAATTIAIAITATTAAMAVNFAANLPPPLPPLPARPTRAIVALSRLPPLRVPALRPGRTINRARPANLKAELGQIVGQVCATKCIYYTSGSGV